MAGAHRPVKHIWFILLRSGLGGLFVYAGALKIGNPIAFADSVATFKLLPEAVINPFALALPIYEILLGALLLANRAVGVAAMGLLVLCTVFFAALASALARGIPVECGCFGSGGWSSNSWWLMARAFLLAAASAAVYRSVAKLSHPNEGGRTLDDTAGKDGVQV